MTDVSAFVGHNFFDKDKDIVKNFLDFFDQLVDMGISFSWEHAEKAEPKLLSQKVLEKIEKKTFL